MPSAKNEKVKAPRNRTIELSDAEAKRCRKDLVFGRSLDPADTSDRIICGDAFDILKKLPVSSFDLLFADPPYNLTKTFGIEDFQANVIR